MANSAVPPTPTDLERGFEAVIKVKRKRSHDWRSSFRNGQLEIGWTASASSSPKPDEENPVRITECLAESDVGSKRERGRLRRRVSFNCEETSKVVDRLWAGAQAEVMSFLHHPFLGAVLTHNVPNKLLLQYLNDEAFLFSAATTLGHHEDPTVAALLKARQSDNSLKVAAYDVHSGGAEAMWSFLQRKAESKNRSEALAAWLAVLRVRALLDTVIGERIPTSGIGKSPFVTWIRSYGNEAFQTCVSSVETALENLHPQGPAIVEMDRLLDIFRTTVRLDMEILACMYSKIPNYTQQRMKQDSPWNPCNLLFAIDYDCTCTKKDTCELLVVAAQATRITDGRFLQIYQRIMAQHDVNVQECLADLPDFAFDSGVQFTSKVEFELLPGMDLALGLQASAILDKNLYCDDVPSLEPVAGYRAIREALLTLAEIETETIEKVTTAGLLAGLKRTKIKSVGKKGSLQSHCREMLSRLTKSGTCIHVISANWSRDLILSGLSFLPGDMLYVHANELDYNESTISVGTFRPVVTNSFDKEHILEILRRIANQFVGADKPASDFIPDDKGKMVVYIGDAQNDMLALLDADLGIILGDNTVLRHLLLRYRIKVWPLVEASAHISLSRIYGSHRSYRQSGILFEASGWEEVEACIFGQCLLRDNDEFWTYWRPPGQQGGGAIKVPDESSEPQPHTVDHGQSVGALPSHDRSEEKDRRCGEGQNNQARSVSPRSLQKQGTQTLVKVVPLARRGLHAAVGDDRGRPRATPNVTLAQQVALAGPSHDGTLNTSAIGSVVVQHNTHGMIAPPEEVHANQHLAHVAAQFGKTCGHGVNEPVTSHGDRVQDICLEMSLPGTSLCMQQLTSGEDGQQMPPQNNYVGHHEYGNHMTQVVELVARRNDLAHSQQSDGECSRQAKTKTASVGTQGMEICEERMREFGTCPVRHQRRASPLHHERGRSPLRHECHTSPLRHKRHTSPMRHERHPPSGQKVIGEQALESAPQDLETRHLQLQLSSAVESKPKGECQTNEEVVLMSVSLAQQNSPVGESVSQEQTPTMVCKSVSGGGGLTHHDAPLKYEEYQDPIMESKLAITSHELVARRHDLAHAQQSDGECSRQLETESASIGTQRMETCEEKEFGTCPVRHERGTSPLRHERGRSPVRHERGRSPLRHERHTSPQRYERHPPSGQKVIGEQALESTPQDLETRHLQLQLSSAVQSKPKGECQTNEEVVLMSVSVAQRSSPVGESVSLEQTPTMVCKSVSGGGGLTHHEAGCGGLTHQETIEYQDPVMESKLGRHDLAHAQQSDGECSRQLKTKFASVGTQGMEICEEKLREFGTCPVRHERGTSPLRHERSRSPLRHERHTSPLQHERHTSPLRHKRHAPSGQKVIGEQAHESAPKDLETRHLEVQLSSAVQSKPKGEYQTNEEVVLMSVSVAQRNSLVGESVSQEQTPTMVCKSVSRGGGLTHHEVGYGGLTHQTTIEYAPLKYEEYQDPIMESILGSTLHELVARRHDLAHAEQSDGECCKQLETEFASIGTQGMEICEEELREFDNCPLRHERGTNPLRHECGRSPLRHERHISPLRHERHTSPLSTCIGTQEMEICEEELREFDTCSLRHERGTSPLRHERGRSPLRRERHISPLSPSICTPGMEICEELREFDTCPLRHERGTSPLRHERGRSPLRHDRHISPLRHERHTSPLSACIGTQGMEICEEELREFDTCPLRHERGTSPLRHERGRSPLRHERHITPLRYEPHTSPLRHKWQPPSGQKVIGEQALESAPQDLETRHLQLQLSSAVQSKPKGECQTNEEVVFMSVSVAQRDSLVGESVSQEQTLTMVCKSVSGGGGLTHHEAGYGGLTHQETTEYAPLKYEEYQDSIMENKLDELEARRHDLAQQQSGGECCRHLKIKSASVCAQGMEICEENLREFDTCPVRHERGRSPLRDEHSRSQLRRERHTSPLRHERHPPSGQIVIEEQAIESAPRDLETRHLQVQPSYAIQSKPKGEGKSSEEVILISISLPQRKSPGGESAFQEPTPTMVCGSASEGGGLTHQETVHGGLTHQETAYGGSTHQETVYGGSTHQETVDRGLTHQETVYGGLTHQETREKHKERQDPRMESNLGSASHEFSSVSRVQGDEFGRSQKYADDVLRGQKLSSTQGSQGNRVERPSLSPAKPLKPMPKNMWMAADPHVDGCRPSWNQPPSSWEHELNHSKAVVDQQVRCDTSFDAALRPEMENFMMMDSTLQSLRFNQISQGQRMIPPLRPAFREMATEQDNLASPRHTARSAEAFIPEPHQYSRPSNPPKTSRFHHGMPQPLVHSSVIGSRQVPAFYSPDRVPRTGMPLSSQEPGGMAMRGNNSVVSRGLRGTFNPPQEPVSYSQTMQKPSSAWTQGHSVMGHLVMNKDRFRSPTRARAVSSPRCLPSQVTSRMDMMRESHFSPLPQRALLPNQDHPLGTSLSSMQKPSIWSNQAPSSLFGDCHLLPTDAVHVDASGGTSRTTNSFSHGQGASSATMPQDKFSSPPTKKACSHEIPHNAKSCGSLNHGLPRICACGFGSPRGGPVSPPKLPPFPADNPRVDSRRECLLSHEPSSPHDQGLEPFLSTRCSGRLKIPQLSTGTDPHKQGSSFMQDLAETGTGNNYVSHSSTSMTAFLQSTSGKEMNNRSSLQERPGSPMRLPQFHELPSHNMHGAFPLGLGGAPALGVQRMSSPLRHNSTREGLKPLGPGAVGMPRNSNVTPT